MTRVRSIRWVATIIGAVICLFLLASFGATAWLAYEDEVADAQRETANLALVLEKHAQRTFSVVDMAMKAVVHTFEHAPEVTLAASPSELSVLLANHAAGQEELLNLFVIDARGKGLAGSSGTVSDIDVSDRSFFVNAREDRSGRLFISEPIKSRAGLGWVMVASRRIQDRHGEFAGVVAASIPVDYFLSFYSTLSIGMDGAITLRNRDGVVYARHPNGADLIGQKTANPGVFSAVQSGQRKGNLLFSNEAGVRSRIVSFRAVENFPFVVSVGIARAEIMRRWSEGTIRNGIVTVTLMILVVALLAGVVHEVGHRIAADKASRRSEQEAASARRRLADAIDTLPWAILVLDVDNRIVVSSRRYGELFPQLADVAVPGAPFADVLRRIVSSGLVADPDWAEKRQALHNQGPHEAELHFTDGRWFRLIVRLTSDGGRVCALEDVTEAKRTQELLAQAHKMEAVGQLTGGVAHDFNNLLTVILGNAGMLIDDVPADSPLRGAAQMIEDAALRGAELTQRLLAFSRQQPLAPGGVDLNRLVEGLQKMLKRTIGEDIDIRLALGSDLPFALADSGQLENAILNLSINARDAMPNGGCLTIETASVFLDGNYAQQENDVKPGPYLMVAVSDNGTGMSPEVLERVFDPFFTTKEVGKGSVLGLSMVYGFAKQSGGHVKIYSEAGIGTTVKLYLPEAPAAKESQKVRAAPDIVGGEGESILVVEDDADVRSYATSILRGLGYTVHEAEDGPSAVAKLSELKGLDLLFTDVILPRGMDGGQLAAQAWRSRPNLPVLYTSGYTGSAILHQGRLKAGARLLNKPYRKADLAKAVRTALGG